MSKKKHLKFVEKHKDVIDKLLEENPLLSISKIARLIKDQDLIDASFDYLRHAIGDYVKSNAKDVPVKEEKRWHVEEGEEPSYKWDTGRGSLKFTVKFIDQLFYEYSNKGLDLSQTEMINRHGFKVWEWASIKNVLWLFKQSNIFSPYTVEITPKDKLEEMIGEKMAQAFNNPQIVVEKQYKHQLNKAHKEVLKRQWNKDFIWKQMMIELAELLPQAEVEKRTLPIIEVDSEVDSLIVPIADLHVGAKVEGIRGLRDYNMEEIKKSLQIIVDEINARKAKKVYLSFVGDLIESFTGMNHPNSWQSMEWGMYGAQVVANAFECMEFLIQGINNLEEIWGVGGNHDRGDSSKKVDPRGEIAGVLFYFLERMYGKHISVMYDPLIVSREVDGIMYLTTHGDAGLSSKSKDGKDIVLKYGDNRKFNVILTGHWHERAIPSDSDLYRWLICPPVFRGNEYSLRLGYFTNPGFLQIDRKPDGRLRVLDESL